MPTQHYGLERIRDILADQLQKTIESPGEAWQVFLGVASIAAGILAFAKLKRDFDKALLEKKKLELELEKLKREASVEQPMIVRPTASEIIQYGKEKPAERRKLLLSLLMMLGGELLIAGRFISDPSIFQAQANIESVRFSNEEITLSGNIDHLPKKAGLVVAELKGGSYRILQTNVDITSNRWVAKVAMRKVQTRRPETVVLLVATRNAMPILVNAVDTEGLISATQFEDRELQMLATTSLTPD